MVSEHKRLKKWVDECAKMCQPDKVVWIDGSEEEKAKLEQQAVDTGEVIRKYCRDACTIALRLMTWPVPRT